MDPLVTFPWGEGDSPLSIVEMRSNELHKLSTCKVFNPDSRDHDASQDFLYSPDDAKAKPVFSWCMSVGEEERKGFSFTESLL